MGAEIADDKGAACLRRIGAPGRLLAVAFARAGKPAQRELDLHDTHGAELAGLDQRPRLPHHRIPGVSVGDAEHPSGSPHSGHQVLRLGEGSRQGLVADDIDPGLKKPLADRVVRDVERDDADNLDAILARHLGLGHVVIIGVAARGIDSKIAARFDCTLRTGAERSGNQLIAVIEPRSDPMRLANKGAAAAADHTQAQAGRGRCCHYNSRDRKSLLALRGLEPEFEAGGVRSQRYKTSPEVKHGLFQVVDLLYSVLCGASDRLRWEAIPSSAMRGCVLNPLVRIRDT